MNLQQARLDQQQLGTNAEPIKRMWLLIIGIIFIAANLRAPLTSIGPLITSIRDSLGLSNTVAGTITTVPLLAFALLSPFVPKLSKRFGMELVLLTSLLVLTVGIILRSLAGVGALFAGTILLGLSIAVCNVLLPSLIKQNFPQKIGVMTGVYTVSMNLCGAIASGVSIPISSSLGLGWKGALGCWGILSFLTILIWTQQFNNRRKAGQTENNEHHTRSINLWRSRIAWKVTLFMGLQSFIYYTLITWLPEILQQQGLNSNSAGWLLSLMQFVILPFTFIVPILAGRMKNQRLLVIITSVLFTAGISGILNGSTILSLLGVILVGIGGGFAFSLAMMFFSLRTQSSQQAAELSGMAQSVGYLLAAVGPTMFGLLHDVTSSWTIPLLMLIVASILILIFGMDAGKNEYVSVE